MTHLKQVGMLYHEHIGMIIFPFTSFASTLQLRPCFRRLVQIRTLLLEVLSNLIPTHLHHAGILHRGRNLYFLVELPMHRVLNQLPQYASQCLTRPGLRNHTLALYHTTERCYGSDLGPHELLHFGEELF
jgi:hypothetical protein